MLFRSGLSDEEINRMREEAKLHEEEDKKAKDKIDKLNGADSLIFQTEKNLKEFGEKIPADKKAPIEKALNDLKEAHKSQDLEAIEKASNELNTVFQAASQDIYNAQQQQGGNAQAENGDPSASADGKADTKDDEVQDVDFEEIKE